MADPNPLPVGAESWDEAARGVPAAARRALRLAAGLACGRLALELPDGRRLRIRGAEPGPDAALAIRDYRFARRLALAGGLGLAESYLRGEWDTPDLPALLHLLALNRHLAASLPANRPAARLWRLVRRPLDRNTRRRARRNVRAHYDLGDAFYAAWLDPTMTYSAALFAPGDDDLAQAQRRKYQAIAAAADLRAGHRVLEIGCGWGGFAAFAARDIGCRVTALTISRAQHAFARRRVAEAGLADRVDVKLLDYRDETGTFDRIVSIEMFEAVGEACWPHYFRQMRDRLAAGGRAALQVITIREESFDRYRREVDFIRSYIFPGGLLPSAAALRDLGARFGLPLSGETAFGPHYAATLSAWRDRFQAAWPEISALGFDERFRRMWEYYLAYCEAGFRSGNIDVRQMVFRKP